MTNRVDDFNRADSATVLGTPSDAGSNWVAVTGTWGINSNRAYCVSSTALAYAYLEASIADADVQVTFTTIASVWGVIARSDGTANNYLLADLLSGVGAKVYKVIGGSLTQLSTTYSYSPANGDVIRLNCNGAALTAYVNGVSRITSSDAGAFSTLGANTKWGIRTHSDTGSRGDDFSVTALAAAGHPTIRRLGQIRRGGRASGKPGVQISRGILVPSYNLAAA